MKLTLIAICALVLGPVAHAKIPEHPPTPHKVVWHINFGCGNNNHICNER